MIDADVWGFSIPRMLGVEHAAGRHRLDARAARGPRRALHLDGVLRQGGPAGHLAGPDAAQGPRAVPHRRLLGRPRLPRSSTCPRAPATSPSRLAQFLPRAEVYVVTTPQPAAQRVAQRAAFMAQKVNLEVKGVIENMTLVHRRRRQALRAVRRRRRRRAGRRASACRSSARSRSSPSCARAATPATRSSPTDPDGEAAAGVRGASPRRSTSSSPPGGSTTPSYASAEPSEASAKSSSRSYGVCSPSTGTSKNPEPW